MALTMHWGMEPHASRLAGGFARYPPFSWIAPLPDLPSIWLVHLQISWLVLAQCCAVLCCAVLCCAVLCIRIVHRTSIAMRLFFILVAAFNLLWFGLQLVFSAATRTDDWAWARRRSLLRHGSPPAPLRVRLRRSPIMLLRP